MPDWGASMWSRASATLLGLAVVGLLFGQAPVRQMPAEACHTFSIVAYDPVHKEWGVGVASRVLAVGAVVPWAKAGVGAVATQSYANPTFGPEGLKLMSQGKSAKEALDILIKNDDGRERRQVGIIDAKGNVANYTGKRCVPFAGATTGKYYSCQGNLLAGKAVIDNMAKAYEVTKGQRLAWRLLAALEAAEKAGGDRRGKQSAAILIVRDKAGYAGLNDRYLDLRVDDHKEPIGELRRILTKYQRRFPKK